MLIYKIGTIPSLRVAVKPEWDHMCRALRIVPGVILLFSIYDDGVMKVMVHSPQF